MTDDEKRLRVVDLPDGRRIETICRWDDQFVVSILERRMLSAGWKTTRMVIVATRTDALDLEAAWATNEVPR